MAEGFADLLQRRIQAARGAWARCGARGEATSRKGVLLGLHRPFRREAATADPLSARVAGNVAFLPGVA